MPIILSDVENDSGMEEKQGKRRAWKSVEIEKRHIGREKEREKERERERERANERKRERKTDRGNERKT